MFSGKKCESHPKFLLL